MEEVKEEKEKMNKDWRHGIFIVSGFTTMLVGPQLLGWTILQSIQVLALFGIVMKLTDIEQAIENCNGKR